MGKDQSYKMKNEMRTLIVRGGLNGMRTLIARGGLDVQHRCFGCDVLLTAYGREESSNWTCTDCALPGKTVATKYQHEKAD